MLPQTTWSVGTFKNGAKEKAVLTRRPFVLQQRPSFRIIVSKHLHHPCCLFIISDDEVNQVINVETKSNLDRIQMQVSAAGRAGVTTTG